MSKPVGMGIVGCGSIAATHVKALQGLNEAKLAAVCDLDAGRAGAIATQTGATAYTDYGQMLRDDAVEAVLILTASGLHADMGIQAARAGKHVVVEKPLDISVERARCLIAACDENGVTLSCIFQHRFDQDTLALKKAIEVGGLGRLHSGCCHTKWYRGQAYYDEVDWRGTKALDGGGALINQSIHQLDLMQHLMGDVDEVYAYTATRAHQRIDVEDLCMATLKFKNGALGVLEASTVAYPGFYTRLDVCGDDGSVILQNNAVTEWKMRDGDTYQGQPTELPHRIQLKDIALAIRQGTPSSVHGREALRSLVLVQALYTSAEKGRPVKVEY